MAKPLRLNFKGRPDRACSDDILRPQMNYIYIDNGVMVATNGHILVKIPICYSDLMGDLELLNEHYIHPRQYREMLTYDVLQVTGKGEITARRDGVSYNTVFKLSTCDSIGIFPNYKAVMSYKKESLGFVGLNISVLKKFLSCFDGIEGIGNLIVKIQNPSKSVHMHYEGSEDVFGLIMPTMLCDESKKVAEKEGSNA